MMNQSLMANSQGEPTAQTEEEISHRAKLMASYKASLLKRHEQEQERKANFLTRFKSTTDGDAFDEDLE